MTNLEIVHPVDVSDVEPWMRTFMMTLLNDPYDDDFPLRVDRYARDWFADRMWGARDRGQWIATLGTEERTLTIPGAGASTNDLTVDALTAVTVAATHRRRGLLTTMLSQSLQAAKDRGDAVSVLIAAEWGIYGRFGYAPANLAADYTYHPRQPGAAPVTGDASRVRPIDRTELGDAARTVFDAARQRHSGQIDRRGPWWDRRLGLDGYELTSNSNLNWFVHDGDDGVDGLLAWKVSRDFKLNGPLGAVEVADLTAATDEAYVDFWAYLAGLDLVDDITVEGRALDEPIRWLLGNGRSLVQTEVYDFLWLRLLDVPAALSARGYPIDGHVVLDVVDKGVGGYAAGRYALTTAASGAECVPTDAPADLRLSQAALASIYLGGHRLRGRAIVGDVSELTPGAVDLVDVMFGSGPSVWTQTGF